MTQPIAVLQGAPSPVIQALMGDFAERHRRDARIVGVIDAPPDPDRPGGRGAHLISLADGRRFPLFQDLGPEAAGCGLDAGGVTLACEAMRRQIAAGCDLVVINKFAQLEADRRGLADAFAAAIEARTPILTAVSPKFMDAWTRFAAPLFVMLPPDAVRLDEWWRAVRG
jgi:hypothetical protein